MKVGLSGMVGFCADEVCYSNVLQPMRALLT